MTEKENLLCIGDEFALQTIPQDSVTGFLSANQADGSVYCDFLENGTAVHPPRPLFARFVLHPANQYTASRALQKFDAKITTEAQGPERAKLVDAVAAEADVNSTEVELATSTRQPAVFGGTYQLLNRSSNKYLQAKKDIAEEDPTALKCSMVDATERSKMPWFSIIPGFRTRNEGEAIRMGDTVVLQSMKMPGMYLHTDMTQDDFDGRDVAEVNIYDKATRFRVVPVAKSKDYEKKVNDGAVCGGDYVELFQRQTQAYLHRSPDGRPCCYNSDGEPVVDNADVPRTDLRADLLWQLNMPTMQWCGRVATHSARNQILFTLRDAISGDYLFEESDGRLAFTDSDESINSHWKLVPFESETTEGYVTEETQFYIENAASGRQLSKGPLVEGSQNDDTYEGLKYDLICVESTTVQEDDLFIFRSLPPEWVQEFFDSMQMIDVLFRYARDLKAAVKAGKQAMTPSTGTSPAVEKIRQQYLLPDAEIDTDSPWTGPVLRVLEYLLDNLSFSSEKDLMLRDGIVNKALQRQLEEIGIINFLLDDMLATQFELVSPEDVNSCKLGPYFKKVTQYAYRVVCMMAKHNQVSSRKVFSRLEDIAKYMREDLDFKVVNTITMVFDGDEKLMRECDDVFIERMWKLASSVKAKRYLVFLTTIVSLDGAPLKFNQDRVSKTIREGCAPGLFDIDFKFEAANTPVGTALAENPQVRFHVGLIQLAASLCAGRHRDSIDFLLTETSLTYSTVLDRLVDASIPAEARIEYAKLMRYLYVDREPLEYNRPVQTCRIMPPLGGSAQEIEDRLGIPPPVQVDPYASLPGVERPTPGLSDLKDAIITIFSRQTEIVATNVRFNQFLNEIVVLAHQLLLFGVYDGGVVPGKHNDGVLTLGDESIELGSTLLNVMDGRTDNLADLDAPDTNVPKRFRTDLLDTNVLMSLKKSILALMQDLFGLRSSTKVRILLKLAVESAGTRAPASSATDTFETETYNPLAKTAQGTSSAAPPVTEALQQLAEMAMTDAEKVRVFRGEDAADTLEGALLDMLRYSGDLDLCFSAFNTLVYFVSQNLIFAETLKKVSILGTDELARNYIIAGQQISEFRRLRKWLHLEDETRQCIACTKQLQQWCGTTEGQDLLRNLGLEEYLSRVLKMRMNTESFPTLLKLCMQLVADFCRENPTNQGIFAHHMEGILLKLLYEPQYYGEGADMLTAVTMENEHLSVMYSPKLVAAVGELSLSTEHGRQIGLLVMLEQLLVVEGNPVSQSQVSICKGALVSRTLIETDGKILDDEWGDGHRMERLEAIQIATADEDTPDKQRAQLGCEYYCKSLEILGICARGKMPTTELLCASMLPFEECMLRMHELYNDDILRACADSHADLDPTARSKAALVAFFREVFVDTNSEHILRSLRRPNNGLWVVEETLDDETSQPIAKHLVEELKRLAMNHAPLPQGDLRKYLYEQACMFFIQYSHVVAPSATAKEETRIIQGMFTEVGEIVAHATDDPTLTPRELVITQILARCCADYCAGVSMTGNAEKEVASASRTIKTVPTLTDNAQMWASFASAAISTVPVQRVSGTDRLVGIGLLKLGMSIWKDVVDIDEHGHQVEVGKYATCLVKPLREKLEALGKKASSVDETSKLAMILDTVRAIPYAITGYDDEKLSENFCKFVEVTPLDCNDNPDLAAVQKEMVLQGWGILALEVVCSPALSSLHLVCLRLLMAMTGGGNIDVQDALFMQITDVATHPTELFCCACRQMLRLSLHDLKIQRKHAEKVKNGQAQPEDEESAQGFAYETLTVMANCCTGNHRGMQDYLRDSINHPERADVIGDVVTYLNMLERDVKEAVTEEAEKSFHHANTMGAGGEDWYDHDNSAGKKSIGHNLSPAIERANAAFGVLRNLASGPNCDNQQAVAASEIFSCVNRILSYCEYKTVWDVDNASADNETAKGQLLSQVSYVLLALLEGVPHPVVVRRMISAIDWTNVARHLKVLKLLIDEGILEVDTVDTNADQKKKKKKKKKSDGAITVPTTTSDPQKDRAAKWLEKEAFRFYTIVEKLRVVGSQLDSNPDPEDNGALIAMGPIFTDVETQEFFQNRVGQVEVVRDGELERLFFMLPYNVRDKKDAKMMNSKIKSTMDSCPREDAGEKLAGFLEGAYEIVANIDSQDQASQVSGKRLPNFFAWCARVSPTMYISAIICVVCCISLDKSPGISRSSMDPETFGRWSGGDIAGFQVFQFFAFVHVVITVARTYAFFRIRFPVLKIMYARQAKLDYLASDPGLAESSFVDRSVVIYGLPYEINGKLVDEQFVSKLLSKYGFVNVARVVPVKPEEGMSGSNPAHGGWRSSNNSFALVTFGREQGVKNVMAAQNEGGDTLQVKGIALKIVDVTEEYVENSGTLSKLAEDAELELFVKTADPLYVLAANAQRIVNSLKIGRFLPIVTAYVFRADPELRESILDIGFSLLGFFYSPLAFSFHLFKITKTEGAAIVVTSMTHNVARLSVTILLCLLFAWVFAIMGLLYFQEFHMDGTPGRSPNAVNNAGGPCPNLLTCFMSYSYAGLMQAGVGGFLTGNSFPVLGADVFQLEFVKTLWEILFSMIAMFVVSIITGIICDTFGELRGEMDEAAAYRASTNFITDIPFAEIAEEKQTHYLQYTYLLLYLRRRAEDALSPLERMVRDKVENGEIDWIPNGRCSTQESQNEQETEIEANVKLLQKQVSDLETTLAAVAEQVADLPAHDQDV